MRSFESLRGRREFALAMRRGAVVSTPSLMLYAFAPRGRASARPRVGVVVTRKVGKAVVRNLVRRRCKAILERVLEPHDARWFVVACRPLAARIPFARLKRDLIDALPKAGRAHQRLA